MRPARRGERVPEAFGKKISEFLGIRYCGKKRDVVQWKKE